MTLFGVTVNIKYMNIEKTYKLTIKDSVFNLTEEEVSALYDACRKALNISVINPNLPSYPPGVRKIDPIVPTDKTTPTYPNWPSYPYTTWSGVPFGTTTNFYTDADNSVMDWHDYHGVTGTGISTANIPSSKGINFISDDMTTIKENDKWRSSIQKSLDKLSAKTNVTTSEGIKVG